jgi:hypothetical protein
MRFCVCVRIRSAAQRLSIARGIAAGVSHLHMEKVRNIASHIVCLVSRVLTSVIRRCVRFDNSGRASRSGGEEHSARREPRRQSRRFEIFCVRCVLFFDVCVVD